MITGHPAPDFFAGIWNCTYICPMVICCGTGPPGAVEPGAGGGSAAACSVVFLTPPMKKLPWSSITRGPPRNFFGVVLWPDTAGVRTPSRTTRAARVLMKVLLERRTRTERDGEAGSAAAGAPI